MCGVLFESARLRVHDNLTMAEITLEPGVLPPPACYADEQTRFDAYVAAIIATVTGGLQWEASETAPADETLFWLRLDGSGPPGRPIEALQWSVADGAWVRWQSEVINTGAPGGAGNAYTLTNSPAMTAATAYRVGTTFTFQSTLANTDTATLNVDGLGARTLKKFGGTSNLAGGDIVVGQIVTVVFDGTNFQVVSMISDANAPVAYITSASYSENNATGTPPASITLTVTKPPLAQWREFDFNVSVNARTTSALQLSIAMTFESGTIVGTNVTTKPGAGNTSQPWLGSVDNDSVLALWRRVGEMPSEFEFLNSVSFKVAISVLAGGFDGNATAYAYIRASYDEPQ